MIQSNPAQIAIVGGRGFVGAEIADLIREHPDFELKTVGTRQEEVGLLATSSNVELALVLPKDMERLALGHDLAILAVPNDIGPDYVRQTPDDFPLLDLGDSFRTDTNWRYGLPELVDEPLTGETRVANPGCYATAAILSLYPFRDLLTDEVKIKGYSGYSGGGNKYRDPSNEPRQVLDNIWALGYSYRTTHSHVAEIADQLAVAPEQVDFIPHVVNRHSGLVISVQTTLLGLHEIEDLNEMLAEFYQASSLLSLEEDLVTLDRVEGASGVVIGKITATKLEDGNTQIEMTAGLDNLRKGAAVQAVQNLNGMFGRQDSLYGINVA